MKSKALDSQTWDDMVFENRHKDYGAYVVRSHYSQNMTAGLGVSVSLACLLVMLPKILAMFGVEDTIIHQVLPKLPEFETKFTQPPTIEQPKVAPPPATAIQPLNNNVAPKVTSTAPIENTPPPNDQIVSSSSDPGTGDGPLVEGVPDGTGPAVDVVPAVAPPPPVFNVAEVMPSYKGGLEAIGRLVQRKVRTPRSVSSHGVAGTVFVQFVVRSDGSVTDVMVIKGIAPDADREAVRLVSLMTDWTPGSQNHTPVSVRMVLPIKFTSQEQF